MALTDSCTYCRHDLKLSKVSSMLRWEALQAQSRSAILAQGRHRQKPALAQCVRCAVSARWTKCRLAMC